MIRRLIRWLARREIDQAWESGAIFGKALAEKQFEVQRMLGQMEGMAQALACVAEAVRGGSDLVSPEDVARAKKGLLH